MRAARSSWSKFLIFSNWPNGISSDYSMYALLETILYAWWVLLSFIIIVACLEMDGSEEVDTKADDVWVNIYES